VRMSADMQVLYRYPIQICHICDISILWGNGLHFSRSYHRFCSIARVFLLFTVLIDPLITIMCWSEVHILMHWQTS